MIVKGLKFDKQLAKHFMEASLFSTYDEITI